MSASGDEHENLPDIERVDVSAAALADYTSEEDFNAIAVDLMKEYASFVCLSASLLPGKTGTWNRNEAILGGLLVRAFKLLCALLDQVCQHRRETSFVIARLVFETMINVLYLIKRGTPDIFDAFVLDSLRHEKKLRERILTNISHRSGIVLPIEDRMLKSIDKAFERSGFDPAKVTSQASMAWKTVNLYDRSCAVGWGDSYLGMFSGTSHYVHGSWHDLLEYHLRSEEAGFTPEFDWHSPRPQPLLALIKLGVETLAGYLGHLVSNADAPLSTELDDLLSRVYLVDQAHERFLTELHLARHSSG